MLQKIAQKTVDVFIYGIIIFSLISFVVCYFVYSIKYPYIFRWYEGLWVIVSVLLYAVIYKIARYFQEKEEVKLIVFMIALEIVFAVILNISYNTQPCSDYAVIWSAACEMAQDSFEAGLDKTDYMYYYNWQIGIAAFESLIIQLFGENFTVLKCLNVLFTVLINYCVYDFCKTKTSKKTACFAYVSSAFFLPWVLTIPQMSNHHVVLPLIFLCFYCYSKKTWWSAVVAGVICGLVNVLRPVGIILVLSILCWSIYQIFIVKKIRLFAIRFVIFFVSYVLIINAFDNFFIFLGYTDGPISNSKIPYFKLFRGLTNFDSLAELLTYNYDYEVYNVAMKEKFLDIVLSNPKEVFVFVSNKMVRYLGLFDYQFQNTFNHNVNYYTAYPVRAFYLISWFQYVGLLVLSLFGYKQYREQNDIGIYDVFFIGNTLVYLLIEAFSSYRFESYPILLVLSALGLQKITNTNFARSKRI